MGSRGARYYVGTHLGFNLKSFEPMRMVLVSTQRGLGDVRVDPSNGIWGPRYHGPGHGSGWDPWVGSGTSQLGYQEASGHQEGPEEATAGSWGFGLRSPQGEGSMGSMGPEGR